MTVATPPHSRIARSAENGRRIAAIDIGSNSVRQIVADVSPDGAITVVDEMKAAPRLGADLDHTGMLGTQSMERAAEAIGRMATLARQLGAERIEAVATSAVRDAANAEQFVARVRQEAGLTVRVIDGADEARLSYLSALAHFDLGVGRTVVMDIGGGSLELALAADGVLDDLVSLPFGALRLTERHLRDGATPKAVRRLRREVRDSLRDVLPRSNWRGAQIIGSGGTFTNLASIHLARRGMLAARNVHATVVPREDVEHILDALATMSPDERRGVSGLNPERADIIVAGLAVAAEVLGRVESRDLHVSRYGIREGLLLELARVTPVVADPGAARERSVRDFAERCHFEEGHAVQVQRLALRLFDAIGAKLGCLPEDRATLSDAALLHDCGYHINYDRHHKHSYHLIVHAELLGIPPAEQVVIANVARYHRGAHPKKKHRNFGELDRTLRERIERLSAILRVADGFDRGHVGAVDDLKVRWLQRAIRITPTPATGATNLRLEMWGAHRKSQLLAELAGVPLEIVADDGSVLSSADESGDDGE
ncbi:MAG TPA: Ppx/GppA phosphatase family protein [Gemmatimonadaceae bacterium]|jgi:exopolyphosphatase/guanosine-5'-triphosphate,3'-diphosphate pyrophosphatase|nr:Ppx/GppA phosphatase family protein [Gemmatimonadaceae bacterium]